MRNPTVGKAIRDWQTNRAISRGGKTASMLAMVLSLAVSLALAVDPVIIIFQALALFGVTTYILTRNTAV